MTWPQPPPTPTLEWQVEARVAEVMDQVHDLYLQTVQEKGFIREIDQAFSKSLMVEFHRLKAITGDDLSKILQTWQANMEAATDKLLRDLDAATQTSTTLPSKNAAVGVALCQFREATQLRVALPLTRQDEAQEKMGKFIRSHLEELRSQQETRNLIGELSSRIMDHRGRVHQLLRSEPLRHPKVVPLILVGMAADRPLESNFFSGLLEGLLGSLSIAVPRRAILPRHPGKVLAMLGPQPCVRPSRGLNRRRWRHPELWGCLKVCYEEDFLKKQRHQIPPIFSDPLFIPHMAKAVFNVVKLPVVLKVLPSANSRKVPSAPNQPEDSGPKLEVSEPKESTPSTSQPCQQVQEQTSEASNTDSNKADEPAPEEEQPLRSLRSR